MTGETIATSIDAGRSLFISYARADRPRVKPLADLLIAAGYDVWWDAMIDGGAAFARTIESKLDSADAVVVVWSATSIASDWVRDEAAHGRDRRRLVPITLDGVEPPLGFRQYHAINLAKWNGRRDAAEFASLERGIASAGSAGDASASAAAPSQAGFSRRGLLMTGSAVGVAAIAGALIWHPWRAGASATAVAVLPFSNLSGDRNQDYFSEGLSEEVRAALVRIAGLKVAAPTSSNEFRDTKDDARSIARKLGVGFLLDGSVRKSGEMVRIAATLTDASTGFSSWSQTFDRKLDDIFTLQSEIANTVAGALMARVAPLGKPPGGTDVVAAYDSYLRGRALFKSDSGEAADRGALAAFEEAITLDPKYAAAHAARSRSLAAIANVYARADQLTGLYDAAIAEAKTAVSLAPDLAAAHLALGFSTLNGRLDFKAARQPYDRAYDLGRGDADILVLCAFFAYKTGRIDEARSAIARAETLDPLNPLPLRAEGAILLGAGRYQESIARSAHAIQMNPKISAAHANIGLAHLMLGNLPAANAAFAAERSTSLKLAGTAITEHRLGNQAAAQAAMARLTSELGDSAIYQQAQVLAQWGKKDQALAALEKARAVRDGGMTSILNDAMLDPLRGEARFNRLLAAMGLA